MARTKLVIDQTEFQAAIDLVETNGPLSNRSELHEAVAQTDWAKNHEPKPVTASVVGLRIQEFGIEPKTPKGRRGRAPGSGVAKSSGNKGPNKKTRIKNDPRAQAIFDTLAGAAPDSLQRTIERARNGSLAAAVRVNCFACMGFDDGVRGLIRDCSATQCAMYPHRPFQTVTVGGVEVEMDEPETDDDGVEIVEEETAAA